MDQAIREKEASAGPPVEEAKQLVGVTEIANDLGVPLSWIYSQTRMGTIPHYKIKKYCRFYRPEVAKWLETMKINPKG